MESFEALSSKNFDYKHFLQYYINLWKRNVMARAIDVLCDEKTKVIEGRDYVVELDGRPMTIGERVEARKILVQEAKDIVTAAEELMALGDEELIAKISAEGGLRVADDMLQPTAKAGDVCYDGDNREGRLESDGVGGLVCKVAETVAAAEPAAVDPAPETPVTTTEAEPAVVTEEAAAVDPTPEAPSPEATV